ncbi:acid protease [Trametes punicea]|nr:acid protease [Trametes punicea]
MSAPKILLVLSLCASYALATPLPATLNIPLFLSPGGRPRIGVAMSTKVQNFNFTFTTSLGYTVVAGNGCQDCNNTPLYDVSLSPSAKSLSGNSAVTLGDGSFQGSLIKENCGIYLSNGSTWQYTNQTVIVADQQAAGSPFAQEISGLLGLGTLKNPTNAAGFSASFDDGIYGQYYIRNPDATNFTFGMDLKPSPVIPGNGSTLTIGPGAKSLADGSLGTLHWLQPDSSAYQTDKVQWRNVQDSVVSGYLANNTQPDMTVQLDGWIAQIGSNNVAESDPILVNVDPYYPGIYMPMQEARLIHDAISGSQQTQQSTIPGETNSWTVPCNTQLQFSVLIGEQRFTVDQSTLVVDQGDGTCFSIIEGFTDPSVTQYIFGQTFISQLYVIFNIPKSGISSVGFAPRSVSSTTSRDIGAIVGGTVGGVAGVVAIGLLAFYLIRRRQDKTFFKRAAEIEEEHKVANTVEPYTFGQNVIVPHDPNALYSPAEFASPPASAHAPLLGMHDAGPSNVPPPTYEEASESGLPSPRGYPRDSKMTYTTERPETIMSGSGSGSPPVSPNRTAFTGSDAV